MYAKLAFFQREKNYLLKEAVFDLFHYTARLMTSQNESFGQDKKTMHEPVSNAHSSFQSKSVIKCSSTIMSNNDIAISKLHTHQRKVFLQMPKL